MERILPAIWGVLRIFSSRRYLLALPTTLALWLGSGSLDLALSQGRYDDPSTSEGWAWFRISRGQLADLNERCGAKLPLDPMNEDDARWLGDCRKLSSHFLEDLLTRSPWREAVPREGVRLKGARIVGEIDLENATLIRPIEIYGSQIDGGINLKRAHTDSLILVDGSLMFGEFNADNLNSSSNLFLRNGVTFKSDLTLNSLKIEGGVDMTGANVKSALRAFNLKAGSYVFLRSLGDENKASFKDVDLSDAKIAGRLEFFRASIDGALSLYNAKITGQLQLVNVSINGMLYADGLQVGDLYSCILTI